MKEQPHSTIDEFYQSLKLAYEIAKGLGVNDANEILDAARNLAKNSNDGKST